jgi:tRNA A22 N-methylase
MSNTTSHIYNRRQFAKNLAALIATAAAGKSSIVFAQPVQRTYRLWRLYVKNTLAVTAIEDLMREHGILYRLLLIYEEIASRLTAGKEVAAGALINTADLIRRFVEDYHEKLEEDFVFPPAERVSELYETVKVLRIQHQAGRNLTDAIIRSTSLTSPQDRSPIWKFLSEFTTLRSLPQLCKPVIGI